MIPFASGILCLFAVISPTLFAEGKGLTAVTSYDGSYEIRVNNKQWFMDAPVFVVADGVRYQSMGNAVFSGQVPAVDQLLVMINSVRDSGKDALGAYDSITYDYQANQTVVSFGIRNYSDIVVFSQHFKEHPLTNTKIPDDRKVLTGFPAFQWDYPFQTETADGYLTFNGEMLGDESVRIERWPPIWNRTVPAEGVSASGPLCLFNTSSGDVVIMSPLTNVMSTSPWYHQWKTSDYPRFPITEAQSYWGIDRDIANVTTGFKIEIILVYSSDGIGKAFEKWGQALRRYYSNENTTALPNPFLDKLGYWTGPGSFYYNNTGQNETYESDLESVREQAQKRGVPLGYMELDDWWYISGSSPDAVVTWDANNQSLPDGLSWLEEKVGYPLVLKCGWWSANTTYATQNNGSYEFIIEGEYALPTEERFWVDLFRNVSQWNVTHVYLDDLTEQYNGMYNALQSQSGLADNWLKNVAIAAQQTGVTLTFSRVLPRMLLAAAQYPSVVQVRAAAPYMDKTHKDQWKIGVTSALAGSLMLAPFKGTFWSSIPHGIQGSKPGLEAAVATLSMGSVALGDRADLLGSPIAARCCRSDGVVLKPSKPAAASDVQIIHQSTNPRTRFGQIWTTVSKLTTWSHAPGPDVNVTQPFTLGVIMAADMPRDYNVTLSMLFPGMHDRQYPDLYVYNFASGPNESVWQPFSDQSPLTLPAKCWVEDKMGPSTPCLFYITPAIQRISPDGGFTTVHILGEDKFVPLSPQRVRYVNLTLGVTVMLQGQPGENVTMTYCIDHTDRRQSSVIIGDDGTAALDLNMTSPVTTSPPPTTELKTTTEMETTTPSGAGESFDRFSFACKMMVGLWLVMQYF